MNRKRKLKRWVKCAIIALIASAIGLAAVFYIKYEPNDIPEKEYGQILEVEITEEQGAE